MDVVRAFIAQESAAAADAAAPTRAAPAPSPPPPAKLPPSTGTSGDSGGAAAPATPPASGSASSQAARSRSSTELIDRVRADLHDAFDGRPVTPDRIAYRLKTDRDLVDAALTYLVTRREARMKGTRGKIAYLPVFLPRR